MQFSDSPDLKLTLQFTIERLKKPNLPTKDPSDLLTGDTYWYNCFFFNPVFSHSFMGLLVKISPFLADIPLNVTFIMRAFDNTSRLAK